MCLRVGSWREAAPTRRVALSSRIVACGNTTRGEREGRVETVRLALRGLGACTTAQAHEQARASCFGIPRVSWPLADSPPEGVQTKQTRPMTRIEPFSTAIAQRTPRHISCLIDSRGPPLRPLKTVPLGSATTLYCCHRLQTAPNNCQSDARPRRRHLCQIS